MSGVCVCVCAQTQLDEGTDPWGVRVDTVAVKDVRIPKELQRSMAAEAEANREAKAKVLCCVLNQGCSP